MKLDSDLLERVALHVPDILLPNSEVDLKTWAVVACDQFTSEPEYWAEVDTLTRHKPSTFHIVFPEVYLEEEGKKERITAINQTMQNYLDEGVLREVVHGFILIRRTMKSGAIRNGLVVALDLDQYDFHVGSASMVRATEKTVMERIPPRVQIRQHAPIELPHVLVLIDDPEGTVIEPLFASHAREELALYETELMMDGGKLQAWSLKDAESIHCIAHALNELIKPDGYLYAVGDGNHSLATAKQCWDNLKKTLNPDELKKHPARYALVELNNLHDQGLVFEPIHRVIFQADLEDLKNYICGEGFPIVMVQGQRTETIQLKDRPSHLATGVLQMLLDEYIEQHPEVKIDYIHGEKSLRKLSDASDRVGFLLEPMGKEELFETVSLDGALPRKTFSMGEAEEKRYYVECRKIR